MSSLADVLRDPSRPAFLFGSTPPKLGTTVEKAKETCAKFVARSAVLATDGYIVYDIQDEGSRTSTERPFPFRKTMEASFYASFFPPITGKECVVYKSVVDASMDSYKEWLETACDTYGHKAFNLVGAASSSAAHNGPSLSEAGLYTKSRGGCAFGCVCIPERHTSKGNENVNMFRKTEFGAEWFITQGVFAAEPIVKLLNDYGDLCKSKERTPKKVILTFAPCGRAKTMTFIKWLGMYVPEDVETRIFASANPVQESIAVLRELLIVILEKSAGSGVPIGINVESLSIFKEEINGAHELFQSLQATLLNSRGSPWSVRWFCVKSLMTYSSSQMSRSSLVSLEADSLRDRQSAPVCTGSGGVVVAGAFSSCSSSAACVTVSVSSPLALGTDSHTSSSAAQDQPNACMHCYSKDVAICTAATASVTGACEASACAAAASAVSCPAAPSSSSSHMHDKESLRAYKIATAALLAVTAGLSIALARSRK